jgi:hypothetical protein
MARRKDSAELLQVRAAFEGDADCVTVPDRDRGAITAIAAIVGRVLNTASRTASDSHREPGANGTGAASPQRPASATLDPAIPEVC